MNFIVFEIADVFTVKCGCTIMFYYEIEEQIEKDYGDSVFHKCLL